MAHFLPTPYPDELFFSVLCRYHVRSGNISPKHSAEDIFGNPKQKVNVEFANGLQSVIKRSGFRSMSAEEILLSHTLMPYYTRFFSVERKREIVGALLENDDGNVIHKMGIYQSTAKKEPHFRYCARCYREDIARYGEPYWHRLHQLDDLRICTVHGCWLSDTGLPKRHHQKIFQPATAKMAMSSPANIAPNKREVELSRLYAGALTEPLDMSDGHRYIDVFDATLKERGWRTPTGKRTKNKIIADEMQVFYNEFCSSEDFDVSRISSTLSMCKHPAPRYILQTACFLGLSLSDLFSPGIKRNVIDSIRRRFAEGESQQAIAREFGIDPATVRRWCREAPAVAKRTTTKRRSTPKTDWKEMDERYYPLVCQLLETRKNEKPQKISLTWVAKQLGSVSASQLKRMSQCAELIARHELSVELVWQRRLQWAEKALLDEGMPISQTAIFKKAGVLKKRYEIKKGKVWCKTLR